MPHLALHLLGPPRIERDGKPVEIDRRKAIALLVYLAVAGPGPGGQRHSRDALATLLWPELDQSRARAGLRRTLAALKKALRQAQGTALRQTQDAALGEGWLDVDRETVTLSRDAQVWLDVTEFQSRLAECGMHGHPQEETCPACLSLLAEAVALYRDDFLAGFTLRDAPAFDDWQFFQTEELRDELAKALQRLVHGYSGQGEFEPAIAYARRWLALDPLCEPAHLHLMLLYARSDQRAAALRQYGECERVMKEELGVSPQEETTQVYEAIKENRELPPLAAPAASQTTSRKHNLPVQLTPFVGREGLLAEIAERLQDPDCRLLTLVGPGGSGKTRLALEVAGGQLDNYPHGVYFVSLAPLQSAEAIVPTIAEALGLRFYAGSGAESEPRRQLLNYLQHRNLLIIMDNFEHLLVRPENVSEAHNQVDGIEVVFDILKAAPEVSIMATSRAKLNVLGEHLFLIAGMDVPESLEMATNAGQHSAVELFVISARRVQPDFELTADNVADVVRICQSVEGMPLSILLAAAWVETLPPAGVALQVERSFGFLETDLHGMPDRHRSIRAVFDHSWNLLTKREREMFQALSVFRGGFTRKAAEQVAGASLKDLRRLVNKSMLQHAHAGRYTMHELLRQYAAEKLDRSPDASEGAHDRHCAYYTLALQQWMVDLKGPQQQRALTEMDIEIENARVACHQATTQGQVERLDQAIEGLCRFYSWRRRYQEGETACRMISEKLATIRSGNGLRVWARVLVWRSRFNTALEQDELADQVRQQSLAILERPELANQDIRREKAFALLELGLEALYSNEKQKAKNLLGQSLALYQALGDQWETARVLGRLGQLALLSGAYDEAKQLHEESLIIRRMLGDQRGIGYALMGLGFIALPQEQIEEGERWVHESIVLFQEIDDHLHIALGLLRLGGAHLLHGQYVKGHSCLEESTTILNPLSYGRSFVASFLAWSALSLGRAKLHLGQYEKACSWARMSLSLYQELDSPKSLYSYQLLGYVALAEEEYAKAQDLMQESIAVCQEKEHLGLVLANLGIAALRLGQLSQARECFRKALWTASEIETTWHLVSTLPSIALLLVDQEQKERAVELYALASRYPSVANSRWFEDVAGKHIAAVAATLPPEVVAAAQERGRARDLNATVAELLVELSEKT